MCKEYNELLQKILKKKEKNPRAFYIFCFAYSLHLALNDVAKRYSDRTEFFISSKKLYNYSFCFNQILKYTEHAFMGHKILNHC